MLEAVTAWVDGLPDVVVYLMLGLGAAVENVIPAIPADTFVVLGGFFAAVGDLQARWVFVAIFLARFLPGIRSVVPVFAGVTHQRFWPVAVPLAVASGIWYGALVWGGSFAGHNLDRMLGILGQTNRWLLLAALLAGAAAFTWWWRTRHHG